jgi:hypothetical protein
MRPRQLLLFLLTFLLVFACWAAIGQPVAATAGYCPYVIPQRGGYGGEPAAISGVSVAGDGSGISFAEWDAQAASVAAVCSTWVPTYYGTTAPASCEPPLMFFDTDATAGANLFGCTSTATWTALGGGGGAPTSAQYIVGALDGTLSAERLLVAGVNTAVDFGTGGEASIDVADAAAGTKGVLQLAGDLAGTAASPSVVDDSHAHGTTTIAGLDAGDTTSGTFDPARLPAATTTAQGAVVLSTSGEGTAGEVVQADDARLDDARTPTAHAGSHEDAGGDELSVAGLSGALADPQLASALDDANDTAIDTVDTPADGDVLKYDLAADLARWAPGTAAGFTSLDADYGDETVTSAWNLSGALLELPNSTAPTGTDCDDAAEAGRVHVDTDAPTGQQLYACEGAAGWVQQGGGAAPGVLYVRDEKTAGTAGGASTATTWQTRILNAVKLNTISGASLATNQVTLPAGDYEIVIGRAPGYQVGRHRVRLRDITNTATLAVGGNEYVSMSGGTASGATVRARFTLAGSTVVELQHYTEAGVATQGLGVATSSGEVEVYAELWIETR